MIHTRIWHLWPCLLLLVLGWAQQGGSEERRPVQRLQRVPRLANPFGVMLPSQLVRTPEGMQVAKTLGAVSFRPVSVFLDQWDGACFECDLALTAGLKLVLTIRNTGPGATQPPSDLAGFRQRLAQVLEHYHPLVLAVENEENSSLFYAGTPDEYEKELEAACEVAHERRIPCTNGGMVGTLVALLVYNHYLENGQRAAAEDFAARVFPEAMQRKLNSPRARMQVEKGTALLACYPRAGADYVNFHWYFADTQALAEAVTFLGTTTGLPVITNEIGQWNEDPAQTTRVMGKVLELGLPVAVWFGLDGPKARGLVERDGTLRPTGKAFQAFIQKHFPGSSGGLP